jgi:hypothetical protein
MSKLVFPSRTEFAALYKYAPYGTSAVSLKSKEIRQAVKRDGFVDSLRIINHAAMRLSGEYPKHSFFSSYFGPTVTLVPAPRSSPLVSGNALWVPRRICEEILAQGLASEVSPCVERTRPVQKSAWASRGNRPEPEDHYDSVIVKKPRGLFTPQSITIVDDFITRGSTFLGIKKRLEEAFPGVPIRCFALVRTISPGDVTEILDPIEGAIKNRAGQLHRDP